MSDDPNDEPTDAPNDITVPADGTVRGARRAMVIVVVASLTVTALLGIVALLRGGFGETERNILYTTLVVATFGTTALCHLAVVTRTVRVVGVAGLAASVAAAGCALVLIWTDDALSGAGEFWLKALVVAGVSAVSLAHANLLLLLPRRRHRALRTGLVVTLVAIALVAGMLIVPAVAEEWFGEVYARVLGVVAIVDALGTIALPVLTRESVALDALARGLGGDRASD